MRSDSTNILLPIQKLCTLTLIISMLVFPTISMFSSLNDLNKDFIELHDEKDTSENEKLEENSKNEKKDLQTTNLDLGNIDGSKAIKICRLQSLRHDIVYEIPLPPPDLA